MVIHVISFDEFKQMVDSENEMEIRYKLKGEVHFIKEGKEYEIRDAKRIQVLNYFNEGDI